MTILSQTEWVDIINNEKFLLYHFCDIPYFFITQSVVAVEYRYTKNGFKYAYHAHSESSYQHAWCSTHKGIEEYGNKDKKELIV